MSRISMVLVVLVAALAGALATQFSGSTAQSQPDELALRAMIEQILTDRESTQRIDIPELTAEAPVQTAAIDAAMINPMIENYLMGDPKILQRVSTALQVQLQIEEQEQSRLVLAEYAGLIYDDPDHVVLGNPNGDVTIVEFFDYNCGYCRSAMPDMAALLDEDPNLRLILKEFPVLSNDSMEAARVAIAVSQTPDADYWAFHEALFSGRGQVSAQSALAAAGELGMNPIALQLDSGAESVTQILQKSYLLAQNLSISGTPTYIIGDEILPGAVGYQALKQRIENMRECGSTICDG